MIPLLFIEREWVRDGRGQLDKRNSRKPGLDTACERGVWGCGYSKKARIAQYISEMRVERLPVMTFTESSGLFLLACFFKKNGSSKYGASKLLIRGRSLRRQPLMPSQFGDGIVTSIHTNLPSAGSDRRRVMPWHRLPYRHHNIYSTASS